MKSIKHAYHQRDVNTQTICYSEDLDESTDKKISNKIRNQEKKPRKHSDIYDSSMDCSTSKVLKYKPYDET